MQAQGILITAFLTVTIGVISGQVIPAKYENKTVTVTHLAYWDISIGGFYKGRILFGLFGDVAPITVSNFRHLTNHTFGKGYKGTRFHRVIARFMLQGGDYHYGDGYGFDSIYGGEFDDETFELLAYGAGWLGMANRGPNTNGCQIYISTVLTDWLNYKHVVFGIVLSGMSVVRLIENTPTWGNCYAQDIPENPVVVVDCGLLPLERRFDVIKEAVTGDGVPEYKRFYHPSPAVMSYINKVDGDLQKSSEFCQSQIDSMKIKLTNLEETLTNEVVALNELKSRFIADEEKSPGEIMEDEMENEQKKKEKQEQPEETTIIPA